ncbi:hypothetical protein [Mycobacterium parmense]|uniref:hypothetical protein n=1 Tax=Mycobacterium parmense TaxID=185642 RepID=UPI00111C602A|nr:hypothetical protein [Mycobacterium parmense]
MPDKWYDDCIALGNFQTDSACHVKQLDPFWHEARSIAYGAAGTHALPVAIERFAGEAELIEISSYRKRVLPFAVGSESHSYPTMRELNMDSVDEEVELSASMLRGDVGFLLAQPIFLAESVLGQYASGHQLKDILDYTNLAVELGVLDSRSVTELLGAKHFIPGGIELGIYPKSWLVQALSKIEVVGRQFLCRYGDRVKKYNDQQIRAVGFLSERLGSYLLIRHLNERYARNIPAEVFGYMTVIVEGDTRYSAGLAEAADRPKVTSSWYQRKQKRAR